VPADEHTRRRVLSKDRMEGFSDGVYGFAATLDGVKAGPSRFEEAEVAQPGDGLAA
jgi:hypothetical protein